jgi:putative FmdB family regulatory protein
MPIYEYRCERGHTFEVLQRMADDPVSVCTDCDATVERVLHPVAVHFKGSGFYTTDYGKQGKASAGAESGDSKNGADGGDKGSSKDSGTTAGTAAKGGESSKTGTSSSSSSSSSA